MDQYKVFVNLALCDGCDIKDAEIDSEDDVGDHEYYVTAPDAETATEMALDIFHGSIAIGVLDCVDVTTRTRLDRVAPADKRRS